jgi:hypothetical protein
MPDLRDGTCTLCRHDEVIQAAPLQFGACGTTVMAVSHERGFLGTDLNRPLGPFNLFVCRRCGYTQWFAFEPEKIPIGTEHGTRLIKGQPTAGPYR